MTENAGVDLKKCPHCGWEKLDVVEMDHHPYGDGSNYFVICPKCTASGGTSKDRQVAIENWNKRYSDPHAKTCDTCDRLLEMKRLKDVPGKEDLIDAANVIDKYGPCHTYEVSDYLRTLAGKK